MTQKLTSEHAMYLTHQLSKITNSPPKKSYRHAYNLKVIRRFLFSTGLAFFLQYLTLIHLTFTYPALPMYPPMGSAFVMLYLFGNSPLLGLFLGSFCAYLFSGLTLPSLLLYITADLGCSYLGVKLSKSVISSDDLIYVKPTEWLHFVIINACTSCLLSSLLRMLAIMLHDASAMSIQRVGYTWMTLWLADLNAVLVFSGFFLTWIAVYLRREPIFQKNKSKHKTIILFLMVIGCVVFLNKIAFMVFVIGFSLYLAHCYGVLIATASSYVLTIMFLVSFIPHQQQCLNAWGLQRYTLLSGVLLIFLLITQSIGQRTSRKNSILHECHV